MGPIDLIAGIAAVGGTAGSVAAMVLGVRAWRQARLVGAVLPTPMGELNVGLHEVRGTLSGERASTSPVTGRPCLWYRLLVEERVRNRWGTVLELRDGGGCTLSDETGSVALDPMAAEVVVSHSERVRTGVFAVPGAELDALLARVGAPERKAAGPFVRWREESLFAGDTLHVVASASFDEGRWTLSGDPFLLSDRDGAELARHQRRAGRRWTGVAVLSLLALGWAVWVEMPLG